LIRMRTADIVRLLALAMIWSASFVFIRVLAPVLGPVWVATAHVPLPCSIRCSTRSRRTK